jgi:hypothetical protein
VASWHISFIISLGSCSMGWISTIGLLALPGSMTEGTPRQVTIGSMLHEKAACAVSLVDNQWRSRSIRQFQELRSQTDKIASAATGSSAHGRYFVFGENQITTILFISKSECLRTAEILDEAKLYSERGRLLSAQNVKKIAMRPFGLMLP